MFKFLRVAIGAGTMFLAAGLDDVGCGLAWPLGDQVMVSHHKPHGKLRAKVGIALCRIFQDIIYIYNIRISNYIDSNIYIYYIIFYYIILYFIILYFIYYIILYFIILYYTILYYVMLYYIILYQNILYYIM